MLLVVSILAIIFVYLTQRGIPNATLNTIVQKAASFAVQAQQDNSPIQSIIHATYANAYLDVIKTISSARQVRQASGVDIQTFEEHINNVQISVTQNAIEKVPALAGKVDLYLHGISNPTIDWAKTSRGNNL